MWELGIGVLKKFGLDIFGNIYFKIGLILAIVGAIYAYGEKCRTDGYNAASVTFLEEKNKALETQKTEFEEQIAAKDKSIKETTQLANNLQREALEFRNQSKLYYSKWKEALDNVPLTADGVTTPFTFGFIGLFNLSIEGFDTTTPSNTIDLSDITRATRIDLRSAGVTLSDSAPISVKHVLEVIGHNGEITNTCLSEREKVKVFLEEICKRGFCTTPKEEPKVDKQTRGDNEDIGTSSIDIS